MLDITCSAREKTIHLEELPGGGGTASGAKKLARPSDRKHTRQKRGSHLLVYTVARTPGECIKESAECGQGAPKIKPLKKKGNGLVHNRLWRSGRGGAVFTSKRKGG